MCCPGQHPRRVETSLTGPGWCATARFVLSRRPDPRHTHGYNGFESRHSPQPKPPLTCGNAGRGRLSLCLGSTLTAPNWLRGPSPGLTLARMAYIRERSTAAGTSWQVCWREGGRAGTQRTATCPTEDDAKKVKALVDVYGYLPDQAVAPSATRPTFGQALAAHLEQLTGVDKRTVADYRRIAKSRFELLEGLDVADIDRALVARMMNAWVEQDISSKTIANARGLLSAVFKTAVRDKHIETNPCEGMRLPRHDEHELEDMVLLTPAEFDLLLAQVGEHWRMPVRFLVETGIRWGELVALDVGDVNPLRRQVRITKAVKRDENGGFYIGPPKTRRARRTVTLPPSLLTDLQPLLERKASAPLFVTPQSRARLRYSNFRTRVWGPALDRATDEEKLGRKALAVRPRIHDLRHTHASWLIDAGVDIVAVSRRLGHESITTTVNTYGHLTERQKDAAADAIERALRPSAAGPASGARGPAAGG